MLKYAVVFDNNDIYVEFEPDKFKELFNKYYKQNKNINKAFDLITRDLMREAQKAK